MKKVGCGPMLSLINHFPEADVALKVIWHSILRMYDILSVCCPLDFETLSACDIDADYAVQRKLK